MKLLPVIGIFLVACTPVNTQTPYTVLTPIPEPTTVTDPTQQTPTPNVTPVPEPTVHIPPTPTTQPTVTPAPTIGPIPEPTQEPRGAITNIRVSSNPDTAPRALDGNLDTHWSPFMGPADNWLSYDLGTVSALAGVSVKTNPGAIWRIYVSTDGTTSKQIGTRHTQIDWKLETLKFPAGTNARYVTIAFNFSNVTPMLFEIVSHTIASPTPTPTVTPTPTPTGPTLTLDPTRILHPANSHVLGTNRNHVTSDFPNGAAKLAKLRELTPTWGQRKYLYRIGHGPTDGRHDYSYMTGYHFEQVWNKLAPYPYDDIREGLKDANTLGADQMHVVNYGTSTPAEAGRYVSYLNKSGDANRAKYPYAQQNVQYFEIGNEIPWTMVRGHDQYASNEIVYATRAKEFARTMRQNSDVPISIGAVASINSNWLGQGWSGGASTVTNILRIMGNDVNFLIYHGYPSWPLNSAPFDLKRLMAQNEWNKREIETKIKPAIIAARRTDVRIANTEFFTHLYSDTVRARGMFGALYSSDTLTLALNQNMLNAVQFCFEHKDLSDASFFIKNDVNNTTAIFKFQKLLATRFGDSVIATSTHNIPVVAVTGVDPKGNISVPRLTMVASKTDNKLYALVTNRFNDVDVKVNVNVGFTPTKVTAHTLSGTGGWDAANGDVKVTEGVTLTGYTFPRASITVLEITR